MMPNDRSPKRIVLAISAASSVLALACEPPPRDGMPLPTPATEPVFDSRPSPRSPVPPAPSDPGEAARYLKENYTKFEHRVPVRDGVELFTVVYVPKDKSKKYPIMLLRTPYGVAPYGADTYPDRNHRMLPRLAPSVEMLYDGYIFVHQDVRGRMMSGGEFQDLRPHIQKKTGKEIDESSDTFDTIEWLVRNVPSNNGRVGMWGVSYPGFYAAQGAIDAHPALKAVSPQAPVTDWFTGDDMHHNGAFFLMDSFDFFSSFGKPRPVPVTSRSWGFQYGTDDIYQFFLNLGPLSNANERYLKNEISFWNDMMAHERLDDFWKTRNPLVHYRDLKPATLVVGGWFDAEDLYGALKTYQTIEKQSPGSKNSLVMGPWKHGGWARSEGESLGDISFGSKTSAWFHKNVETPFFAYHLKGKGDGKIAEAWVFETGTNEWHAHDSWPPRETKRTSLWLRADGVLAAKQPDATESEMDEYVSDPAKPVPYREKTESQRAPEYMIDDQRFASKRPDVLVYSTPPLVEDVSLAGPIDASLWVSTTGTDADFIVKVIDVFPEGYPAPDPNPREVSMGGYQMLVRAEVMRGKFRNSLEHPEAFKPGEPTLVHITLPDVCHAFRPGHKIMVQIQSTWFPLVDRNPQKLVEIPLAKPDDFQKATHRVFHAPARASEIKLTLLRGKLPG